MTFTPCVWVLKRLQSDNHTLLEDAVILLIISLKIWLIVSL